MSSFSLYADSGGEEDANKVVDAGDNEEGESGDEGGSGEEDDVSGEEGDELDEDEEGDEGDEDEDDNFEDASDEDELPADVEEHMEEAGQNTLTARQNFFEETVGFDYKGQFGEYHIRAYKDTGENDDMGYQWPVAFVAKDKHWVNAAMWVKNDEGEYELISIWAYNAKYEFSAQYYLEDYNNEDLAPFFDSNYRVYEHIITDGDAIQHFSCSDPAEAVEEFYCPALDVLSEKEMQALRANDPPAAGKRQKV